MANKQNYLSREDLFQLSSVHLRYYNYYLSFLNKNGQLTDKTIFEFFRWFVDNWFDGDLSTMVKNHNLDGLSYEEWEKYYNETTEHNEKHI